jgi:hypothetical protein
MKPIVNREFIGGPMDGHVHAMPVDQEIYLYGDHRGYKKGEYLLHDQDGKMYHVEPYKDEAEGNPGVTQEG